MKLFLRAKHWQVFLIFVLGTIASNFTYVDNPTITIAIRLIGLFIFFSWVLFVSHGLYDFLPKKIYFSYNLFLANFFIGLTIYPAIIILSDGDGMTFKGFSAIPIFYVFYALLHISTFPVRLLNSIEMNRKAKFSQYVADVFLLIFWPIGIWIVQPRINKIAESTRDEGKVYIHDDIIDENLDFK